MSQLGSRLIQAAEEAAAMARGGAVPGAVIHAVPARAPDDAARSRRAAVPERPVVAEDTDDKLA
jgi:hypothetical protein